MHIEIEEESKTLSEYWVIFKRRRYLLLIPAVVIFILALLLALGLPANYRSTATVLIEEQEIPKYLVRSTITNYAAQQIQMITQKVMTLDNIQKIAEKYNLYNQADVTSRMPRTDLAKQFSDNVELDLVSADVIDPQSGRPTKATIAFTLSVNDRDPSVTQKVANELVTLYLKENLRNRSAKASGAADFLTAQVQALNAELRQRESVLAIFKEDNEGALPELYQFNLSVIERTEQQLSDVNQRNQELEKRKIQLSAELAQLNPSAPIVLANGQAVLSDVDRLRALQSDYHKKSAIYYDDHPDLKRLMREIKSLQATDDYDETKQVIQQQIQVQRDELAVLQQRHTIDHPSVFSAEKILKNLEEKLSREKPLFNSETVAPDNPSYILLDTQLKAVVGEMTTLKIKKTKLQKKINQYEELIKRAPSIEKDYLALLRDYQTTSQKYYELRAKLREAEVAKSLEQERKGERFTLIEPPILPLTPVSPNRMAIMLIGFILAIASGIGCALLFEAMDQSIRGVKALTKIMGTPPFVMIPYLENNKDKSLQTKQFAIVSVVGVSILVTGFIYTHFYFKPLDVLWFVVVRKAGLG